MLSHVRLVDQWRDLQRSLPGGWHEAKLQLTVIDEAQLDRAAALLAPLAPGRGERQLRLDCTVGGAGPRPEALRRSFIRLDAERIDARLELVSASDRPVAQTPLPQSLARAWESELESLPADWSDIYAEVELRSTDHVARGALLMAPLNPARHGSRSALHFRSARLFGYGASAGMVRRCLERLDEERITGELRILRALSDTRPAQTQGPVWYVGGNVV